MRTANSTENSNVYPGELLEVTQCLIHACKGQLSNRMPSTHSWGHLTLLPLMVWNFFSRTFFTGSSSLKVMKTKPRLLFDFGSIGSSMASICKHKQSSGPYRRAYKELTGENVQEHQSEKELQPAKVPRCQGPGRRQPRCSWQTTPEATHSPPQTRRSTP